MLHEVVEAGYEITPEDIDADIIIINTCAFIESARKEAVDNILDRYRKQAQYGEEVFLYHADREALAAQVKERLLAIDPDAKVRVEWIGAIIGAYTGAGCVGLAFHER